MDWYTAEDFLPICKSCGGKDFKRTRSYTETEFLSLDEDGRIEVDDSDMDGPDSEYVYECCHCGSCASDLDWLLEDKPEEEDDDDY
jgi:hypothetical protein